MTHSLEFTKLTLIRWVASCTTHEQMDFCHKVIREFLISRFKGIEPDEEIEKAEAAEADESN